MKNLIVRTYTHHRRTARLVAIVLFSALLSATPFHAVFAAQTAPSLGSAGSFAVLSAAPDAGGAVTLTDSTVIGDVGSSGLAASVVLTNSTITGATIAPVDAQVLTDFNKAYDALARQQCDTYLTGDLTGLVLTPGVYCVAAASTTTNGTLTLSGTSTDTWIFKIGTSGTGALTGTGFDVVMEGGGTSCNVYWWVAEAATLTDSNFLGTILAGAAITVTRGTFNGDALAKAAVTLTGATISGCEQTSQPVRDRCNQGVGNGPEDCDPGNSNQENQGYTGRSNDELGGTRGDPGRKGGNGK